MADFAGMASGFRERGDHNYRRRVDLANAFEEFKRNNPHATYQDMQSFIDARSNGMNYLRGGAPSEEVLRGVAAENQRQKAMAAARQATADASERMLLMENAYKLRDHYLLESGGDVAKAMASMGAVLGEGALGLDLPGMFSPAAIQEWENGRMLEVLPRLEGFMQAVGGNLTVDQVAQQFRLTKPVAEAVLNRFNETRQRANTEWLDERRDTLTNLLMDAIKQGKSETELLEIARAYGGEGRTFDDAMLQPIVGSAMSKYESNMESARATNLSSMARMAADQLAMKMAPDQVKANLTAALAPFGLDKDDNYINTIMAQAQAVESGRMTELVGDKKASVLEYLEKPVVMGKVADAIANNDPETARQVINDTIDMLITDPAVRAQLPPNFVDTQLKSMRAQLEKQQSDRLDALQDKGREVLLSYNDKFLKDYQARFSTYFGDAKNPTSGAGQKGVNERIWPQINALAQRYYLSDQQMRSLSSAVYALSKEAGPEEINEVINEWANSAGLVPLTEAREQGQKMVERQFGMNRDDPVPLDRYVLEKKREVDTYQSRMASKVAEIHSLATPEEKSAEIVKSIVKFKRLKEAFVSEAQLDVANRDDVIKIGSGKWDNQDLSYQVQRLVSYADQQIAKLEAMQVANNGVIAQAAKQAPKVKVPDDERLHMSPFRRMTTDAKTRSDNYKKISAKISGLRQYDRTGLGAVGAFFTDPVKAAEAQLVTDFASGDGLIGLDRARIEDLYADTEATEAFVADPVEFILTSDFAKFWREQNPELVQEVMRYRKR